MQKKIMDRVYRLKYHSSKVYKLRSKNCKGSESEAKHKRQWRQLTLLNLCDFFSNDIYKTEK